MVEPKLFAGWAVVRQIREDWGTCSTHETIEKFVDSCTGNLKTPYILEDTT